MMVVVMHFSNRSSYKSISSSTHSSNILCSYFQLGVVLCRSGVPCLVLGEEMVKVSRVLAMALLALSVDKDYASTSLFQEQIS